MEDKIDDFVTAWDINKWLDEKSQLADCIWVEGALLAHEDDTKIYLEPAFVDVDIIYEVSKSSIKKVIALIGVEPHLATKKLVRVFIDKKALVVKLEYGLAAWIPSEIKSATFSAESVEGIAGTALTDYPWGQVEDVGQQSRPTPRPSPTPRPPRAEKPPSTPHQRRPGDKRAPF